MMTLMAGDKIDQDLSMIRGRQALQSSKNNLKKAFHLFEKLLDHHFGHAV